MKNNLFFFHGENSYSISKKIKLWTDTFEQKHGGDMNIEIIEGKHLDPKKFSTNLKAMPFLAEKRLVIVKDYLSNTKTDDQKIIAEILEEEIPEFCVLVFVENSPPDKRTTLFKFLNKNAKTEEFTPLNPAQLTNWILDETLKRKGKIERFEADFLGQRVGNNLWQLSNEIDKLISATHEDSKEPKITKELIESLVTESLSASIFRLTDSIATKNRKESLRIFKTLVDSGEEVMMIFHMLIRGFRILIQVNSLLKEGSDTMSIAKKLKLPPFVATQTAKQTKNFTDEQFKKIYSTFLEIDKSIKTGGIKLTTDDNRELLLEIERFIINTCK